MKLRACFWLLLLVCTSSGGSTAWAQGTGWMQPGVRLWYFGGVEGADPGVSNAAEAYLIQFVTATDIVATHHSALANWESPLPAHTTSTPVFDMGPAWIHPQKLQTVHDGEFWQDQEITLVQHLEYTYATFPYHFLPIKALFDVRPQREIVELSYMMPDMISTGNAYFDAETGLLLYHHVVWGANKMFFILAEINYDFARQAAFAEDDGPHTGFRSDAIESSLGNPMYVGGGVVSFQSTVETRYGSTIEMLVQSSRTPAIGTPIAIENYCFFGNIPIVRRMDHAQAPNLPPEQWNPFGQHLWWWVPPTAAGTLAIGQITGGVLSTTSTIAASPPSINVMDVPMTRIATDPLTYVATQAPARFFFDTLWFDSSGYLTAFAARDPASGLNVKPGDFQFNNVTSVRGLSYYRASMRSRMTRLRDFDGDAKSDVTVFRPSSGTWYQIRSSTGVGYGVAWGVNGDKPVPGDYDGDGKTDVAVYRPSSGVWYVLKSTTGTGMGVSWGLSDDVPVPADYDGDGKTDVAVYRPTTGVWYIIKSSVQSATGIKWGTTGDVPVPADFDGDGKADPTVFRQSTGTWYELRSTTGSGFGVRWGQAGDVPLAGDFDGDGKADPTVFRAATGTWYELRSTTGSGFGVRWGLVGDRPIVGDYDGDGKADPTVFRPSTSTWYQLRSSTGGFGIVWGRPGDQPI